MKKLGATMAAAVLALAVNACDSATGADGDARLQVAARGDDPPASQSASGAEPAYQQTTAQGTVTFRARVYAQTSAGSWVELTNRAAQEASVDASGRGAAQVFATSRVQAGAYGRVRVVFEDVTANMSGNLQVSTGLLNGQVRVDMASDGEVVVERQVAVTASAGATTQILLNLNADAWLNTASAQTRSVSEAAFASAVQVSAQ